MSNINIEDVNLRLTETRNELSEEDLRLCDGLENERVSRIAGDDANKSLTLQVQDSVSGTERRLSTEVIHREQGDLDKLGLLNQLSQSMSAYRIKTDKEIEAERFARDILGINLDARITTAEASFNHKELKLYQDIQEVFTNLDGKYTLMDARIKKYEDMLQDITMDSIKITMDNGEINMGAWTILSQAREWDLEILSKMRGFQEKTTEDVNQALEELQNQLPITENIINEIMESLSESPLIAELRDALNGGIDYTDGLAVKLAQEEAARAKAMIDLAYANAQALAAEKAALAESLAAEAQARADEVQEEANRRIESIRQIREDVGQEVNLINGQIATDIGLIKTELKNAKDGFNSSIEEVRGETDVVLNELTTYKASNDVAIAGLVSKVNTNVTNTAANASKIEGLTSELATTNTELGKVRNTSATALSKADTAVSANSALVNRVDALAAAITESEGTVVDVNAFNALKAEVNTVKGTVTGLVEDITALESNYTSVNNKVTTQGTAISTLNTKMSTAENSISQSANDITLLKTDINKVNAGLLTKVDSQAFSQLSSDVTELDGKYTTQASLVTDLRGSLDTTNVNVGNATSAAQNAMNAAGAKGKVIFGNTAPVVGDRLVQNLWIDTTGNANTPKRWNGSAWVSVTDKVATDALAAANAASNLAKTKADTSAFNSLDQKVTVMDGKVSTNTNSITSLSGKIGIVEGDLATKLDSSALVNYYTKQQADDNALSTAAGEISKYDASLVIGGTNLYSGTTDEWQEVVFGGWQSYLHDLVISPNGSLNAGDEITWSGEVLDPINNASLMLHFVVPSIPLGYIQRHSSWANAGEKTIVKGTTVVPEGATAVRMALRHDMGNAPISAFKFRRLQIEKGSKVTDWSPSPRDTQASLDANATAISDTKAEVIKVDGKTTVNANNISGLTSRMGNVEGKVATKAEASALQNYYTKTEAEENATTVAAGEVAKYDAKLTIGGSNLYFGPNPVYLRSQTSAGRIVFAATASGNTQRFDYLSADNLDLSGLQVGDPTIASIEILVPSTDTSDYTIQFGTYRFSGSSYVYAPTVDVKTLPKDTWVKLTTAPGTYISGQPATGINLVFNMVGRKTAGDEIRWRNFMMEKATTASSFVESDKSTQAKLDANATAITNTNSEVSRVDGRVTTESNRITSLSGRVSTVEGGLTTKADVSALNNIYTKTEADAKATSLAAGEVSKYDASLVIGGSNLQDNADFKTSSTNRWSATYGNVTSIEGGIQYKGTSVSGAARIEKTLTGLEVGQTYTLSVWAKSPVPLEFRGLVDATAIKNTMPESHDPLVFQRYTCTFIPRVVTGALIRAYVPNLALPDVVILNKEKLEVGSKGTDWSPSSTDVQTSLDVNANAISTTISEVERVNSVVKGHTAQLSNLTASIAGKASSAALDSLTVRVEAEEGKSSTQASSITSLTSKADDLLDVVTVKDTRSTNQPPSWYLTNYARRTVNEFKTQTAIGVGGFFGGAYCNLETKVYYPDLSGGHIIQTATSSVDPSLYVQRTSTSTTAWTAWKQPIKDLRDDIAGKASASALSTLSTKVDEVDGVVTTQANQLIVLTSDNNANKNALTVQGKVIDGVKSSYMVKMETNGVIGGFGLMQSTGVLGQVVTSFGVNANSFFVGAPASKKQPFIVTTTNQVVNGVTYPAGTYIDVALIANATIGTAKIADLAVTAAKIANATITNAEIANTTITGAKIANATIGTAQIANLAVTAAKIANATITSAEIANAAITTAKIGDLQVDTLKIKDNAVTVPAGYTNPTSVTKTDNRSPTVHTGGNAVLLDNSVYFGNVASITIQRAGGKCRIEGSIAIEDFGGSVWTADHKVVTNGPSGMYIGIVLLRNGSVIGYYKTTVNKTIQNQTAWFNGSVDMPIHIDDAFTGTATYAIRVGLSCSMTGGILISNVTGRGAKMMQASIAVLELKK